MKEETLDILTSNIKNTCYKCKYALLGNPENTFCPKYKEKPYSVYFEGKSCPFFEISKYAEKNEAKRD